MSVEIGQYKPSGEPLDDGLGLPTQDHGLKPHDHNPAESVPAAMTAPPTIPADNDHLALETQPPPPPGQSIVAGPEPTQPPPMDNVPQEHPNVMGGMNANIKVDADANAPVGANVGADMNAINANIDANANMNANTNMDANGNIDVNANMNGNLGVGVEAPPASPPTNEPMDHLQINSSQSSEIDPSTNSIPSPPRAVQHDPDMAYIDSCTMTTPLENTMYDILKRKQNHITRLQSEIKKMKDFVSKRKQSYKRKRKDQSAPRRALSAYNIFIQDRFAAVKKKNEEALESTDADDVMSRIPPANLVAATGLVWRDMAKEEKAKYEERARLDRKRYDEQMAQYQPPEKQSNRKRNKTGYNMFFSAHVLRLKQTDHGVPSERGSVARLVGTAWKQLSAEDKQYYEREADKHNGMHPIDKEEDEEEEIDPKRVPHIGQPDPYNHMHPGHDMHMHNQMPPPPPPQHHPHPHQPLQHDPRHHGYAYPPQHMYGQPHGYYDYGPHHGQHHAHGQNQRHHGRSSGYNQAYGGRQGHSYHDGM